MSHATGKGPELERKPSPGSGGSWWHRPLDCSRAVWFRSKDEVLGDPDLPDRPVGSGSLVVLTQLSVSFAAFLAFGVWIRRKVQGQNSAAHAVIVLK